MTRRRATLPADDPDPDDPDPDAAGTRERDWSA